MIVIMAPRASTPETLNLLLQERPDLFTDDVVHEAISSISGLDCISNILWFNQHFHDVLARHPVATFRSKSAARCIKWLVKEYSLVYSWDEDVILNQRLNKVSRWLREHFVSPDFYSDRDLDEIDDSASWSDMSTSIESVDFDELLQDDTDSVDSLANELAENMF
nr:hypothetical protein HK105_003616 [Polyrhizophydium stewartii]